MERRSWYARRRHDRGRSEGFPFAVDRGGRAPEVVGVRYIEMRRALRWDDVR